MKKFIANMAVRVKCVFGKHVWVNVLIHLKTRDGFCATTNGKRCKYCGKVNLNVKEDM